jgi:hypothetical protein
MDTFSVVPFTFINPFRYLCFTDDPSPFILHLRPRSHPSVQRTSLHTILYSLYKDSSDPSFGIERDLEVIFVSVVTQLKE